jgi:toxin YoeB
MNYKIRFSAQAQEDAIHLKKYEVTAYNKLVRLLVELTEHPYTGTGKPKPMKYGYTGCYSRRITKKHRLVYSVNNEEITVLIISVLRHYDDK